jgi:cytochrome d ubiquinol oxidase subunit I
MAGIGFFLIALGLFGAFLWLRKRLFESRLYLRIAALAWPLGFIAILAGWVTTESGRQPWIAYGILRTSEALSPVSATMVALSLAAFVLVYGVVFSIGVYYINRLINRGPQGAAIEPPHLPHALPNRPLGAAGDPEGRSR